MEIQHALVDLQYLAVLLIDEVSKERKIQKKKQMHPEKKWEERKTNTKIQTHP